MTAGKWDIGFERLRRVVQRFESAHSVDLAITEDKGGRVLVADQSKGKLVEFTHDRVEDCGAASQEHADAGLERVKTVLNRLL